ncbi:MAG: acetylxylan esterase [Chitinophagaceae bacterium]|nr:MAG: acetylxylan esterase [Chitinophagaceae bacterium]
MKFLCLLIAFFARLAPAASQQNFVANYDEAKVPPYTLPDVLKTTGNKTVTSISDWEKKRRPEILQLFADNVYGQTPKEFQSIKYTLVKRDDKALGGRATLKEVLIEVSNNNQTVQINLLVFVPNGSRAKAPAFLLINNRPRINTDPTRDSRTEFWPAEMAIDSGYAMAAFHVSDLAPDNKDSFANASLRLFPDQLIAPNGMRAIGAWAWGASRVMDYFETDNDIDAKKIAVVGHSRGGKASLWAAAQDHRFAICVTNNSGNSGAALSKRIYGETVGRINNSFPHWFTTNYKKYNENEAALPVDQHMLLATIAPRPLYVTNASEDLWADPTGTYLATRLAAPVYELYGIKPNLPATPPVINEAIIKTHTAYHNRQGKHDMTAFDWNRFIQFASYHYAKKNSYKK